MVTAGRFRSVSKHFSLRRGWSGPSELGPYKSTCGCACRRKDKPKRKVFKAEVTEVPQSSRRRTHPPEIRADGVVEVMVEVELDVAEGDVGILEAAQEERAFEGADD